MNDLSIFPKVKWEYLKPVFFHVASSGLLAFCAMRILQMPANTLGAVIFSVTVFASVAYLMFLKIHMSVMGVIMLLDYHPLENKDSMKIRLC